MWLPKFESDEHSSFYSNLCKSGFTKWATLPRETGFYSLFGFGLLLHTYVRYKELGGKAEKLWQQIKEIQKVDESLQDKSDRYETQEFWERLDVASRTLCASLFTIQQIREKILNDRESIFSFSDTRVYNQIAAGLGVCLHVYEEAGQGRQTREFLGGSSKFGFIVCIASVDSKCSVLIHKDFLFGQEVTVPGFPHFVNNLQTAQPCSSDIFGVLPSLINTINSLTTIIHCTAHKLPSFLQDDQESLRSFRISLAELPQPSSSQLSNLDLERLRLVAELPRSEESCQPHTVRTCEFCQNEGETFTEQSHTFHSSCLAAYLNSLADRGTSQLVCPNENCHCILPENVLERFPSIKDRFRRLREAPPINCDKESICESCYSKCVSERLVKLDHGCTLCGTCGGLSLVNEACKKCDKGFTSADYDIIHLLAYS